MLNRKVIRTMITDHQFSDDASFEEVRFIMSLDHVMEMQQARRAKVNELLAMKNNLINEDQKKKLEALCQIILEKLKLNEIDFEKAHLGAINLTKKEGDEIYKSIDETMQIIKTYKDSLNLFEKAVNDKQLKWSAQARTRVICDVTLSFSDIAKDYENKISNYNLGQKFVIAAGTFVGALLGAIVGLAVGVAVGSACGGGLGSIIPGWGTLIGAIGAGSFGGVKGFFAGLGLGASIGTAAATAALATGGAVLGNIAGRPVSKNSIFFNQEQQAVRDFRKSLEDEVKDKGKVAKEEISSSKKKGSAT